MLVLMTNMVMTMTISLNVNEYGHGECNRDHMFTMRIDDVDDDV